MSNREPPVYQAFEFAPKRTRYCCVITSLNEGSRIRRQLKRMSPRSELADIVIADGASTDGSTEASYLRSCGVRALLYRDNVFATLLARPAWVRQRLASE